MSRGKWYGGLRTATERGRVQFDRSLRERVREPRQLTLPEHVLRLAQREYESQFGHEQDYERMQERGGLSLLEVVGLLADLAERHGAKPTDPRPSAPVAEQEKPRG